MIATDPDSAGWQSAQRAFWRLAALRANPQHLTLPEGIDPADILRTEGSAALAERLAASTGFAAVLIDTTHRRTRGNATRTRSHESELGRDLARIIGALPPDQWPQHAQHVAERLDLPLTHAPPGSLEAGTSWTDEPNGCADSRAGNSPAREPGSRAHRGPGLAARRLAQTTAATMHPRSCGRYHTAPRAEPLANQ